jgi:hypothetical protein
LRNTAAVLLAATFAAAFTACAEWQPFYQPPQAPTENSGTAAAPTPMATPTPTPGAVGTDANRAAAIAIEKANRAAEKAAEAAKIAAEASAAAHEAAAAAAKASLGAHPATPSAASPAISSSAGTAARSSAGAAAHRGAASPPTLVTDSSTARRDDAVKSIQAVSASVRRIDRTHLGDVDAQTYDLAVSLLDSAQKSLIRKEYSAAASLSHKAAILLGTIPGN